MAYRYKVIPFIGQSKGRVSPSEVASQLQAAISEHAVDGWEFYQLADVNIEVAPGCIAALLGANTQYMRFDQLIFRSDRGVAPSVGSRDINREHDSTAKVPEDERHRRETAPIDPKILEVWRRKTDDEIREAASSLHQYTETGREVILAEIARRRIVSENREAETFCYHCGSDVVPGSRLCTNCGKAL
jgi:hypothetical protein